MSKNIRVSLIDPILYKSSYINHEPKISFANIFWRKFNLLNFVLNVLLPIIIIIFVLFVLKDRYLSKLKTDRLNIVDNSQNF